MFKTLTEVVGVVAVVAGVAMIFPPAAFIVAGVAAIYAVEVNP
jgi:hypothetical protein